MGTSSNRCIESIRTKHQQNPFRFSSIAEVEEEPSIGGHQKLILGENTANVMQVDRKIIVHILFIEIIVKSSIKLFSDANNNMHSLMHQAIPSPIQLI